MPQQADSAVLKYLQFDDDIQTFEILRKEYIDNGKIEIWLKISTEDGIDGWIYYSSFDPYGDGSWTISQIINTADYIWTIRKYRSLFIVSEKLNVRNTPGIYGSTVIYQLLANEDDKEALIYSSEMTEETELIDGLNDHWIKIEYGKGKEGWIFAGYAYCERGGPKYLTHENKIAFSVGYY